MRHPLLVAVLLLPALAAAQGVAIGAGNPTPAASAILDLQSTTQGLLPPRMTTTQRTAIAAPATGLVVYDTTVGAVFVRTASAWVQLGGGGTGWNLTGNAGTDSLVNYLGTSDDRPLVFRINNQRAGYVQRGYQNTALGYQAFSNPATGAINATAFGYQALFASQGASNTAIGSLALSSPSQNSSANTAVGREALKSATTGGNNTAVGSTALLTTTTGHDNCAWGYGALRDNTTGNFNIAGGIASSDKNTSGSYNISFGYTALQQNTTGSSNIAIGARALRLNTIRSGLIAIGDSALYNNGTDVGVNQFTAIDNVAVGHGALYDNTLGSYNTAVGNNACGNVTTGTSNTGVGRGALYENVTGAANTGIGNLASPISPGYDGTSALGNFASPTASNRINIGTSANNNLVGVFGAVQNLSDGRFKTEVADDVPGIAFITKLRPVTYHLDAAKVDEFVGIKAKAERSGDPKEMARYQKRVKEVSAEKLTGFIAQEVEQAAKEVGYDFDGVQLPKNEGDTYTLGYSTFVVPLVKAVQEQQQQIEAQQRTIAKQQQAIEHLENRMNELMHR